MGAEGSPEGRGRHSHPPTPSEEAFLGGWAGGGGCWGGGSGSGASPGRLFGKGGRWVRGEGGRRQRPPDRRFRSAPERQPGAIIIIINNNNNNKGKEEALKRQLRWASRERGGLQCAPRGQRGRGGGSGQRLLPPPAVTHAIFPQERSLGPVFFFSFIFFWWSFLWVFGGFFVLRVCAAVGRFVQKSPLKAVSPSGRARTARGCAPRRCR